MEDTVKAAVSKEFGAAPYLTKPTFFSKISNKVCCVAKDTNTLW